MVVNQVFHQGVNTYIPMIPRHELFGEDGEPYFFPGIAETGKVSVFDSLSHAQVYFHDKGLDDQLERVFVMNIDAIEQWIHEGGVPTEAVYTDISMLWNLAIMLWGDFRGKLGEVVSIAREMTLIDVLGSELTMKDQHEKHKEAIAKGEWFKIREPDEEKIARSIADPQLRVQARRVVDFYLLIPKSEAM